MKNILKNSSKLFFSDIWISGITFIQTILVARFLGTQGYGILALITIYVTLVNQLVDFRIKETVVKYASEFIVKKDKEKLLATVKLCYLIDLSTGILAFLIVIFTAKFAAQYIIRHPEISNLIALYSIILLISTVDGTCHGVLSAFEKFSSLSLYSASAETIKFIVVIVFLSISSSVKAVLLGYVLSTFINSTILLYLCLRVIKNSILYQGIKGKISSLRDRQKEIAKFLLNTNFNELFTLFTKNMDIMILGYFRNAQEVGYYRLAKNFVNTLGLISNPFYTAIYPPLSKLWSANEIKGFKSLIKKITLFMTGLSLPVVLIIFIAISWVIEHTVGIAFLPSALLVRIMLPGIFIAMALIWIRPTFLSMGRLGILTSANLFSALTMFLFSLVIIPKLGSVGSALFYVYPYFLGHVIAVIAFIKILKGYEQSA